MLQQIKNLFSITKKTRPIRESSSYNLIDKVKIDHRGFWQISSEDIVGSIEYKKQEAAYFRIINKQRKTAS